MHYLLKRFQKTGKLLKQSEVKIPSRGTTTNNFIIVNKIAMKVSQKNMCPMNPKSI